MPSSRPVNPNFSVVVALMEMSSGSMPMTPAKVSCMQGFEFGAFATHGNMDVAYFVTSLPDEPNGIAQQYLAVDVFILRRRIGKVKADVAHCRRSQKGIAHGMNQHIGIGVSQQAKRVVDAYAAQPQLPAFDQPVHVKPHSYTYLHRQTY